MTKAVSRAGLNWKVVENKWPGFMEVFHDFDPECVANLSPKQIEAIERNPAVIRNRSKIEATAGRLAADDLDRRNRSTRAVSSS